jgi:hypothetical protein
VRGQGVWLGDDVITEDSQKWLRAAGWEFFTRRILACPTQSVSGAETHVSLHVKCPLLLSDFNQIWNVSKSFRAPRYQISQKYDQRFSSPNMRRDRRTGMAKLTGGVLQILLANKPKTIPSLDSDFLGSCAFYSSGFVSRLGRNTLPAFVFNP